MGVSGSVMHIALAAVSIACAQAQTASTPSLSVPYPDWVATDALGRTIAQNPQTGPEKLGAAKTEKYVGLFYYLWHGSHNATAIYDNTQLIQANPGTPAYGPEGMFHWWGKPEAGYYRAGDPWVIRRNLQMLAVAGVDFVFFDVTNAYTYLPVVDTLCRISMRMRAEGLPTPHISFCTKSSSGKTMNALYDQFYAQGKYKDLWFQWEGKPLMLGDDTDPALRSDVKAFFNIKYSWAWTDAKNQPNQWQWIDTYPQNYGWNTDKTKAEQLPVAKASHPNNNIGESYMNGSEPARDSHGLTAYTGQGRNFTEQWKRVAEVNPRLIMITQWNEWVAQRFLATADSKPAFLGRQLAEGETYFVDCYNQEYNRDIEPMENGHSDNHYYLMVDQIRRFKGLPTPPPPPPALSVSIDGAFSDWAAARPVYADPHGDAAHRDFARYDAATRYTNATGRNDIVEARVALDGNRVAFYAKAADDLTPHTDPNWMMLFIDADRDKSTGWEGFDYAVNVLPGRTDRKTALCRWDGKEWKRIEDVDYAYAGKEIELSIPRASLGLAAAEVSLQFQWADNLQKLGDINEFFVNGDAAPDRRFHYAFASKVAFSAAIRLPGKQGGLSGRSGRKVTFLNGFVRESFLVPALQGEDGSGALRLRVSDARGRTLSERSLNGSAQVSIPGQDLGAGLQWFQCLQDGKSLWEKRMLILPGAEIRMQVD